ncbi:hypothetical protein M2474_001207 [Dysgonomonas sp. PH5-37]|uniref:hypothetical protein n=2 Tax=unclassified Dysgonomonas TaxID=2630389 RepID=UPI00247551E6|nr:hypothetical protein [Dysgonomonas sp. PH5-37]MDH6387777.1 hypothetical protein [Dysgonomonas sp. PH5-37]
MNDDIKVSIINRILKLIPPHVKPVNYLAETLDIGKESAYRRLRGEMSFSFTEMIKLSQDLKFSLDEIVGLTKDTPKAVIDLKIDKDPKQTFLEKFRKYKEEIDLRLQDETSSTTMALNCMPAEFCVHFKDIFKFFYFAWLHRKHTGLSKLYYSDIEITPELELLRSKLNVSSLEVNNNTYIMDPNVFLGPLREVCYFRKLKLMNDDDFLLIKKNFHDMIDFVEKMVRTGGSEKGAKHLFYLSNFNIDGNSSYSICDGNVRSSFNFHFYNRVIITNPEICEIHKEWLDSLKKYSTLITTSNEIVQANYFEKQREYIDRL